MIKKVVAMSCMQAVEYVYFNRSGVDNFAIISIQETSHGGNGFDFTISGCCKDVLTVNFDDVNPNSMKELGYEDWYKEQTSIGKVIPFDKSMANFIKAFVDKLNKKDEVNLLIIHCAAGVSRSPAVAAAINKYLFGNEGDFFETQVPNKFVYDVMSEVLSTVK